MTLPGNPTTALVAADVPVVLRGRGTVQVYITVAINFMTARKAAATG
jgi:hypothetical protein